MSMRRPWSLTRSLADSVVQPTRLNVRSQIAAGLVAFRHGLAEPANLRETRSKVFSSTHIGGCGVQTATAHLCTGPVVNSKAGSACFPGSLGSRAKANSMHLPPPAAPIGLGGFLPDGLKLSLAYAGNLGTICHGFGCACYCQRSSAGAWSRQLSTSVLPSSRASYPLRSFVSAGRPSN